MITEQNTLEFLQALQKAGEFKSMAPFMKLFKMSKSTPVLLMEKGLIQKLKMGKPVGIRVKGRDLTYHWKNPGVLPNHNTAKELNNLICKQHQINNQNFANNRKTIRINNKNGLNIRTFQTDLAELKQKYEDQLDVSIIISVEIKSTETFEL